MKSEINKLLIIGRDKRSTQLLIEEVKKWEFIEEIVLILENNTKTKSFIKRKIKRNGIIATIDFLAFQVFSKILVSLWQYFGVKGNSYAIKSDTPTSMLVSSVRSIESANSEEFLELVAQHKPSLILLSGCSILKSTIIEKIECVILNIHAGITPYFRGVHGAYWSLVENELPGVTLHEVDAGIDTGKIISQKHIKIKSKDHFWTYPTIQLETGLELLKLYLSQGLTYPPIELKRESKIYTHPKLSTYLYFLVKKGIK